MLAGSSILYVFSLFMVNFISPKKKYMLMLDTKLSLCTKYWQIFLAQGVGMGLALGFIMLPGKP